MPRPTNGRPRGGGRRLPDNTLTQPERDALVLSVVALGHKLARDYVRRVRGVDQESLKEDLYAAAMHGAVYAARVFQPAQGHKFVTYAYYWMWMQVAQSRRRILNDGLTAYRSGCKTGPCRPKRAYTVFTAGGEEEENARHVLNRIGYRISEVFGADARARPLVELLPERTSEPREHWTP